MTNVEPVVGQQSGEFEKLKNNSNSVVKKRGGARPGAGRKKGGMNYSTMERMAIKKAFEDRIHRNVDKLLDAALTKAQGESYLMCQVTTGTGSNRKRTTHIVTDPEDIRLWLDDELEFDHDKEYYYITTRPADNSALQALLDRAFGKPAQKIEDTGTKKLIIETRHHKG